LAVVQNDLAARENDVDLAAEAGTVAVFDLQKE
jgi:hypothetical protein